MEMVMKRTYKDRNRDNWADPVIRQKMLKGSRKGAEKSRKMTQRDRLILEWRRLRRRCGE
jgi:hypothetical protein